jgi:hypothetical protein
MAGPLTVVVLIVAGHEPDATTQALVRAMDDAIGPTVVVDLRETPVEPDGDQAVALEAGAHASALAELEFDQAGGRHVRLRVHLAASDRWLERQVAFEASDADAERGRTLGYVLAAMLPSRAPDVSLDTPPQPAAPPAPPEPGPSATSAEAGEAPRRVGDSAPSLAFDLMALVATGFDDIGDTFGGGLAAHWFPEPHVSLRLGVSLRGGNFEPANGIMLNFAGAAGVAWHPWRAVRHRPFGMSVRLDYLVGGQSLTHYSTGGPSDPQVTWSRSLAAVDGFVDGTFRFAPGADFVLGLGIEYALGATYIDHGGGQVELPVLQAVAESGLRVEF